MPVIFLWAAPLALVWMLLTSQWTWQSAIVGYIFGVGVMVLIVTNVRTQGQPLRHVSLARLPLSLWAFLVYVVRLFLDILSSGVDVALRIIPAKMRIQPTFHRVPVQDESAVLAALSAQAITITPGSLVVDFEEDEGQCIMIVHVLDGSTWTQESLTQDQRERVRSLCRIMGRPVQQEEMVR
ncbi:MAG: Na+/H+ antiporter subunit E [Anaerolineae bacterium]|nr:Na+/H+ antiporter subunit E [Anaerolineae bacterium]MDW8172043.1 Na+/H+ antiporter subunit E [Anaerolineae bacterium]